MEDRLSRIEDKIDNVLERVGDHRERLTKLETTQKGFVSVISALWVAAVAAIGVILKKMHW